jgi:DNA-binding MarR family transcriptional regulator
MADPARRAEHADTPVAAQLAVDEQPLPGGLRPRHVKLLVDKATPVQADGSHHAHRQYILLGRILRRRESDHIDHIVSQWRRERPDLDTTALALFGRLFRVAHLADIALSEGTAAHGLRPGWFDLLAALRRAGPPYELRPTDLMGATMLSSGGITKRLDRLVAAGLVERRPDPADRRAFLVRLTRKGRAVVDRTLAAHIAHEERLLAVLGASDRRELDDLLHRLLVSLEAAR